MVVAEGWTHKSLINLSAVNPLTNKVGLIPYYDIHMPTYLLSLP